MVRDAVNTNDLPLWWCQWLLHVHFTFVFEKILEVEGIQVSFVRDGKKFHFLATKTSLISLYAIFDVFGLSQVSQ